MPPRHFYQVPSEKYLFKKDDNNPEEKVRQWALFELLSTYGYYIQNINIENTVPIGSKTYRADIVVYQDNHPYIVIECKKENTENTDRWNQVLSYAERLQAEFAVWTNAAVWIVKRRKSGVWLDTPDIPKQRRKKKTNFANYSEIIGKLALPLFWHNRSIPSNETLNFLYSLTPLLSIAEVNKFSNAPKSIQRGFHQLVYLAIETTEPDRQVREGWLIERLLAMLEHFEKYFTKIGFDGKYEGSSVKYKINRSIEFLRSALASDESFQRFTKGMFGEERDAISAVKWEITIFAEAIKYLAENSRDTHAHTELFMASSESITRYIKNSSQEKPAEFSEGQAEQILKLLEELFLAPLEMFLPTKIDDYGTEKLHEFCEPYWKSFLQHREAVKATMKDKKIMGRFKIIEAGDAELESFEGVLQHLDEDWINANLTEDTEDDE